MAEPENAKLLYDAVVLIVRVDDKALAFVTLDGVAQRALLRQQAPGIVFDPTQVSDGKGDGSVHNAVVKAIKVSRRSRRNIYVQIFEHMVISRKKSKCMYTVHHLLVE